MARRKKEPMSEGKKNIIGMLLEEYDQTGDIPWRQWLEAEVVYNE